MATKTVAKNSQKNFAYNQNSSKKGRKKQNQPAKNVYKILVFPKNQEVLEQKIIKKIK